MIIYQNTSRGFLDDVDRNQISDRIRDSYTSKTGKKNFADSEDSSWINSMEFMGKIIRRSKISDDCGVLIEFSLPTTSKRIDFIVAGEDANGAKNFVIVELKQWKEAKETTARDLVLTKYYGGRPTAHPSYQASSYKNYLSDFNENVFNKLLLPHSCAYLHNYKESQPEPLKSPIYESIVSDSPIYFKDDFEKLEAFIKIHVGHGKGSEILYKIEKGNIKPSKKLIDHVVSLFRGNQEFIMLDEQKVAFEMAFSIASKAEEKTTVIITGGPGTGKSVISMSLVGALLKNKTNVFFAAPTASFRESMVSKLGDHEKTDRIKYLFKGSGSFLDSKPDSVEAIIVDEAHRLKNGKAYMYKGDNQVDDIIKASKVNIFFVDEDQVIRPEDIGTKAEIKRVAEKYGSRVEEIELTAQFRCAGADGYVNWITDVLQIRETGNYDGWDKKDFDFRLYDDPKQLVADIHEKASQGFKARVLAGYAWDWTNEGNTNAQVADIQIPEFDFSMPWNSRQVGSTWAINDAGLGQIGCVHTSQGLEFDYVGVIIGKDLKYNPETGAFSTAWSDYKDKKGKQGLKDDPRAMNLLVRNIYRILLTRGMKGCYVFAVDKDIREYLQHRLKINQ